MRKLLFTQEEQAKIIDLYINSQFSMDEIANIYKCYTQRIQTVLIKNNIRIRSISELQQKYKLDINFLNKIDNPEKAYFLGFFCADGTFNKKTGKMSISIAERDGYILNIFKEILKTNKPIYISKPYGKGKQNIHKLEICNKIFFNNLIKLNIEEKKTTQLTFPKNIPKKLISHFIRGYFDGDGCLVISKNQAALSIISTKQFIESIKKWCDNLSIKSFIYSINSNRTEMWYLRIGGKPQIINFLNIIYKDKGKLFLTRKYEKFLYLIEECKKNSKNTKSKEIIKKLGL